MQIPIHVIFEFNFYPQYTHSLYVKPWKFA